MSSHSVPVSQSSPTFSGRYQAGLHRVSVVLAACTFGLIFVGGAVTSNDAGMAVPDWPTTFGENMFTFPLSKWVGDVFFEHTHRLWGAMVGMVMIAAVGWTMLRESRRWVKVFAWSMLAAVVVQGVMGGLRVTENSIALAIAHGCLAQVFFSTTLCLVLFTSRPWKDYQPPDEGVTDGGSLKWLCMTTNIAILGQLILGALYRHRGTDVVLAFHVVGAVGATILLSCLVMWISGVYHRQRLLLRPVKQLGALLVLQLMLGVGAYVLTMDSDSSRPAGFFEWAVPSMHVAVGALMLAVSAVLTAGGFRVFHRHGARIKMTASPTEVSAA